MTTQKKFVLKIYAPDDLSKNWFVYYYDSEGKRQRKYGNINTFSTYRERLAEATSLKSELEQEIKHGKLRSLRARAYDYLETHRSEWRKKTYQGYKSQLDIFYQYVGRERLSADVVHRFFADLRPRVHARTFNKYKSVLSMIFGALGEGHCFEGIERKRGQSTPARYFQRHQVARLKREIEKRDPELWLYIQFIYYCALRPNSEVRRLRADDILLESKQIRVRGEIAKNRKTLHVAIPDAFLPDLQFVRELEPKALIFPSSRDCTKPIGYNTMTTRHRKFLRELGFSAEYQLYSWKHTGAVEAVRAGAHPKELQIHLRHASLEETDGYLRQLGVGDFDTIIRKIKSL